MKTTLRCAIYTRKSSEEGLDQEFNSLDAQREACTAYISSQRGEGWTASARRYDDGGWSGGNMDRPGLKSLLTDIEAGDPKLGAYKALLEPDDDLRLTRLAACLRLAEYLERSRAGRVRSLEVSIDPQSVTLRLIADETPRVELWEAAKQGEIFRKAFGRELHLESGALKRSAADQDRRLSTPDGKTKRSKH